jgi:hypothetical protein
MDVFLIKKGENVVFHTDLTAMEELDGRKTPDKTVSIEAWEDAGSIAYIDPEGNIQLGLPAEEKARREEIESLATEETLLLQELASKDYQVVKNAEMGKMLANVDPELHERRQQCRTRINEIRQRLFEISE